MKKLIAVCGKSASGKDTIVNKLIELYPKTFNKKIAYTTRTPRKGEKGGKDYFFKTDEEFFNLVANNEMYEATDFNGEMYGTGIDSLKEEVVNIGIFDPIGLELMSEVKDVDMIMFYIDADEEVRFRRLLDSDRDFSIEEIYKRHKLDESLFADIEMIPEMMVLDNSERDLEFVVEMLWMVAEYFFKFDNSKKI